MGGIKTPSAFPIIWADKTAPVAIETPEDGNHSPARRAGSSETKTLLKPKHFGQNHKNLIIIILSN